MTAAQPNNIGPLADAAAGEAAAKTADQSAEQQPEYVGDMPDDRDEARTYRPGDEQTAGSGS